MVHHIFAATGKILDLGTPETRVPDLVKAVNLYGARLHECHPYPIDEFIIGGVLVGPNGSCFFVQKCDMEYIREHKLLTYSPLGLPVPDQNAPSSPTRQ